MCKKKVQTPASDSNQKEYREFFGIVDSYLIQYNIDDDEGWIVFIDGDNDIDWVDTRKSYFTDAEKAERAGWLAKLDSVHHEPCSNISRRDKLTFKKKLATAYELLMVKRFQDIQPIIDDCRRFVKARNREASRSLFLMVSLPIAILSIIGWIIDADFFQWHLPWVAGCVMGLLGAFVSIWTRFGKVEKTGLSSKWLHILETVCRLFIGVIFAIVAICAIRSGILLKDINPDILPMAYGLVGFAAGFSERMVPSMIEKIVNKNIEEDGNVEA